MPVIMAEYSRLLRELFLYESSFYNYSSDDGFIRILRQHRETHYKMGNILTEIVENLFSARGKGEIRQLWADLSMTFIKSMMIYNKNIAPNLAGASNKEIVSSK